MQSRKENLMHLVRTKTEGIIQAQIGTIVKTEFHVGIDNVTIVVLK